MGDNKAGCEPKAKERVHYQCVLHQTTYGETITGLSEVDPNEDPNGANTCPNRLRQWHVTTAERLHIDSPFPLVASVPLHSSRGTRILPEKCTVNAAEVFSKTFHLRHVAIKRREVRKRLGRSNLDLVILNLALNNPIIVYLDGNWMEQKVVIGQLILPSRGSSMVIVHAVWNGAPTYAEAVKGFQKEVGRTPLVNVDLMDFSA
ncbi:unnamed protein product [Schistocephalus solidus]|uniref:Beta-galactosidase n=1 Tax=Schistocephalus solidus TaxID=70667 RepID=A0A183T2J4_SCHSO|nr:unnamed protein product [Schistocephalus solidus]